MRIMLLALIAVHFTGTQVRSDEFPEQFYTNGRYIDTWNPEEGKKVSLWFSRLPARDVTYEQDIVTIFDDEPEWAYYQNQNTKEFVGRFSYKLNKYSLLPEKDRRTNRKDIADSAFPEPGEMPRVDQIQPKSKVKAKLLPPPPTREHPALAGSTWNTTYFTKADIPVKALVRFDSSGGGTYELQDQGQNLKGQFSEVKFSGPVNKVFSIIGIWQVGERRGHFRFLVSAENLNQFQGEWGEEAKIEGIWSGTRVRPRSAPE
jgi:hypothetical protein